MNWFELSVKSRANESVPVSLPTIYSLFSLCYVQLTCTKQVLSSESRHFLGVPRLPRGGSLGTPN